MPQKTRQVLVRVSDEEHRSWKALAKDSDLTLSDWVRKNLNLKELKETVGDIPTPVYGYVMRTQRKKHFKVGITRQIRSRLSHYKMHSTEGIRVAFLCMFESQEEALLWEESVLEKYREFALHGEWLKSKCGLEDEINSGSICGSLAIEMPEYQRIPGRPKLCLVCIRVTEEELKLFKERAMAVGKTLAQWARDLAVADIAKEKAAAMVLGKVMKSLEPAVKLYPEPQQGVTIKEGELEPYRLGHDIAKAVDRMVDKMIEKSQSVPDEGQDESEDAPMVDEETEGW